MLAGPFKVAAGKVPHPTAGVAQLLSFFEENLAGTLFVVAEGVVDGESDLVGDEGEVADFARRIGIGMACAEAEAAETAVGRCEREDACSLQIRLFKKLH